MKKKLLITNCSILLFITGAAGQVAIQQLRTENLPNPVGIDVTTPRFSWQLVSNQRAVKQTAWEIKVTAGKTTV